MWITGCGNYECRGFNNDGTHPDMAVMSFTKAFKITHQPTGASFGATARMTETFVCTGGEWKVVAFQETMVPNPARPVYKPAAGQFDDYVASTASGRTAVAARFR